MPKNITDLPHALKNEGELDGRLSGKRLAVFLDYDGVLTPILDRPEDAVISESMRNVVSRLAERCPVCVVSGRDREVVQKLMGVDNLIVAGSHGFDIWSPEGGEISHNPMDDSFEKPLETAKARLGETADSIEGASVEEKSASVAIHYRLVADDGDRAKIKSAVDGLLAEHPDELKVTPGKMVYEIQPNIDWDKGKAVLYLLEALELDGGDVVPIYLGDDLTDENAFRALEDRGVGVFVGVADDPELEGRSTAADYALDTVEEVERFLDALAR